MGLFFVVETGLEESQQVFQSGQEIVVSFSFGGEDVSEVDDSNDDPIPELVSIDLALNELLDGLGIVSQE